MAGQKTKTASKKSALKPSKGKSIKGGTKGILTQSAEPIEPALSNHESESGTSGTEDDDDNEEGLEKLMKALGEEGHSTSLISRSCAHWRAQRPVMRKPVKKTMGEATKWTRRRGV
jgi:hypothetical protein